MKSFLVFLSFAISGFYGFSSDLYQPKLGNSEVTLTKEYQDKNLGENEALLSFHFKGLSKDEIHANVRYSLNDAPEESQAMEHSELRIKTSPGTYKLAMYINSNYYEIFTDSLTIAPQTVQEYAVTLAKAPRLTRKPIDHVVYKPVIYLYPEVTTEVEVVVDIHGTNPFYYPNYNSSWNITAHADGGLEFNGELLNYLFWEADDEDHLEEIDVNEGFVVNGDDAVSFLETKLKEVGFTSEERADFITFWGPKLAANETNLVRFEWNEVCDKFANLSISPQPDHIYRFYIFMSAIDTEVQLQPQVLPQFNREGFVVLEWGGQISNYQPNTSL